ncbi:hypothetical protein SO694_00016348 [Aureococcus anophagefferens]|uniref:Uncharacterized protein n=1 Tax=Aureococcus anophagefferens TaxID=44056 RepID=A0ABR1G292_AURAN|nr:hypothetical protein JL722_3269 [Aureococcus anophagefferens]
MDWYRWACARWRDQVAHAPAAAPQTTPTKRPRAAGESPFKATSPLATLPAAAQEKLLAEFEDSSSDEEDDEVEEDETEEQGAEEGPAEEPEADGALFTCPNTTNIPPSDYTLDPLPAAPEPKTEGRRSRTDWLAAPVIAILKATSLEDPEPASRASCGSNERRTRRSAQGRRSTGSPCPRD